MKRGLSLGGSAGPSPASPVEALVGVIGHGEGGQDEAAGHGAHLLTQPLGVLADTLVSSTQTPVSLSSCPGSSSVALALYHAWFQMAHTYSHLKEAFG